MRMRVNAAAQMCFAEDSDVRTKLSYVNTASHGVIPFFQACSEKHVNKQGKLRLGGQWLSALFALSIRRVGVRCAAVIRKRTGQRKNCLTVL